MKYAILLGAMLAAGAAQAAPPGPLDPDWPCQQVKVPYLSTASMWSGPAPDAAMRSWSQDGTIADLVARLSERRLPIDRAQQEITHFAATSGADRTAKLTALFAGLFETLGQERTEVIAGLDRFGQRQKELAQTLRTQLETLRSEQDSANPDQSKIADLTNRVGWDTQVLNDRRQTLSYACQMPDTIAQRLFELTRTIQQLL